jgi:hypothetical protein
LSEGKRGAGSESKRKRKERTAQPSVQRAPNPLTAKNLLFGNQREAALVLVLARTRGNQTDERLVELSDLGWARRAPPPPLFVRRVGETEQLVIPCGKDLDSDLVS